MRFSPTRTMSATQHAQGNHKASPLQGIYTAGDDIKSCYLKVFEEKTEFSLTASSCLSALCLMVLLVVCTSYIRMILIKYLKEAITSNSLEEEILNSANTLTEKLVLNSEKLERNVLALRKYFNRSPAF